MNGAERRQVAHVVLVEAELHPLANLPVELLVLLVEVRLLAVEVDLVLEVDVRRRPGVDHVCVTPVLSPMTLPLLPTVSIGFENCSIDSICSLSEVTRKRTRLMAPVSRRPDREPVAEEVRRRDLGDRELRSEPPRVLPDGVAVRSVLWMRKSFRTYWFSLKTPLRAGLSATHPALVTPSDEEGTRDGGAELEGSHRLGLS